jgi:hypothetical protein
MQMTAVAELVVCPTCGYEFGPARARVCLKCHSHICPECGKCLCEKVASIFNDPIFKKEW